MLGLIEKDKDRVRRIWRERRQQNIEYYRAKGREHYQRHKGKLRSRRQRRRKTKLNKHDPLKIIFDNVQYRANKLGIEFTIKLADLSMPELCPVFGIPLFFAKKGRCDNTPTLDRIDNSRGYIPENVCIISWLANRRKNDSSIEDLKKIIAYMQGRMPSPRTTSRGG